MLTHVDCDALITLRGAFHNEGVIIFYSCNTCKMKGSPIRDTFKLRQSCLSTLRVFS